MENWKVALVSGAAGAGTAMFLKKKWTAGIILAGVGLAARPVVALHQHADCVSPVFAIEQAG